MISDARMPPERDGLGAGARSLEVPRLGSITGGFAAVS